MTLALMLGICALYAFMENGKRINSTGDILAIFFCILFSSTLLCNSSINIYLLEKFFLDWLPGKKLRIFSIILFVLASISILFIMIGAVTIFSELSSKRHDNSLQYIMGFLIALAIAAIGITGCYILWNQISLRKAIRRNYEASLNNFLDSDQP
jgi:uncharacterized membrane protein